MAISRLTVFAVSLPTFAIQKEIISQNNKKSEPISDLENLVRIYMRLVHPAGVEPVAFRVGVARMGF